MSDIIDDRPPLTHDGRDVAPGRHADRSDPDWERSVLRSVAMEVVNERRTARRWGIFFKLLTLGYVLGITGAILGWWGGGSAADVGGLTGGEHTAVVDINGVIKADSDNSAQQVNRALRAAFKDTNSKGVILRVNSPGGSPVQSGLIFDEIKRLRAEYKDKPIYAVVEEICASGGYYVAAAADKIFVDRASLVGSIGVLMDGFGFVGTMHKLGVERRLFTAGADKGFLDPFSPLSETQRDHLQGLLDDIHGQFIESVRTGRGDRLKKDAELFSGLIWTGARSVELGLADAIGSVAFVARDQLKAERLVSYSRRKTLIERVAERIGLSFGKAVTQPLEQIGDMQMR